MRPPPFRRATCSIPSFVNVPPESARTSLSPQLLFVRTIVPAFVKEPALTFALCGPQSLSIVSF